jgi:hypothetical protein
VPAGNRFDCGTSVDPIDLDPVKTQSVLDGPIQKKVDRLGVIGRRDQDRQNEAERAGQDMALDALDFLVAVEPTLTSGIPSFLGMGEVDPDVWHPKYRSTEAAM